MNRREILYSGVGLAAWSVFRGASAEDTWPTRPVKLIVPYSAGGGLDVVARIVGERLGVRVGQPFVVDNRTGASGIVGADAVAKARPDGYTLLATVADTQINNAVLFKQIPYDPLKDFVAITQMAYGSPVMVVPADVPARNLAEFSAYARANRGKLSYGSWGVGGLGHVLTEAYNQNDRLELAHAPYRGEAAMLQDLLTQSVVLGMGSVTNMAPQVQAGKLRAIAICGTERASILPDTGTFAEQGYGDPAFKARVWMALLAPARTPPQIVERVAKEVHTIIQDPVVARELVQRGFEPVGNSPTQFAANLQRDYDVLTGLIRKIGIQPQ